ncbi:hypothetical protein SeHA_C4919 [Salmonella enterica subsp. enterica serovar Heidelberg str. SL476]|uniref:Secreted protein n=1 Tax=Salmonella heidelberg (strain SL476) TaxID=454169 RepID=A0A6C6ZHD2_SALHS|nr:hypothetical protein SeHA_C4919 [Salmonella enterica subsp. enterica serovar Heidelberg str. SL476]AVU72930.1 hypothetical protein FORC58_3986 [Salmonella enterica subsp. enterica serovar Typhimurium]CEH23190.1 hypothetical protein SMA01_3399 [Salmonella enterica subsp. enterica serovar Manhattan str. 111113]VXG77053.1 hypothetical protein CDS [Salmonella enterica subsp. enterica serovar Derby]
MKLTNVKFISPFFLLPAPACVNTCFFAFLPRVIPSTVPRASGSSEDGDFSRCYARNA